MYLDLVYLFIACLAIFLAAISVFLLNGDHPVVVVLALVV